MQSSQMSRDSYNQQRYGMNSQYFPRQSTFNVYPHQNLSVYDVYNNEPRYSLYQPQGYMGKNLNSQYGRQSQFNHPQY